MNIGIHSNQFDGRGTTKVPLDYAINLKKQGYNVKMICSLDSANQGIPLILPHFDVITYTGNANNVNDRPEVKKKIEDIVNINKLDFLYMVKWGTNDNVTPSNCKTGIHCVFDMSEPHGNVYAGVSEYITKKYNKSIFVPHIIKNIHPTNNLRIQYNIPENATVIGRHGGSDTFNLPFVQEAVKNILAYRDDIYFIFLSTNKFIDNRRVIFIPWVDSEQEKFNFIHSCDAMLHARADGETFGIAIGEFSAANKPIITWDGDNNIYYDKAHLDILGKKAITYNNYSDILNILYSIKKEDIQNRNWDIYSTQFSEQNVMNKFKEVFLT